MKKGNPWHQKKKKPERACPDSREEYPEPPMRKNKSLIKRGELTDRKGVSLTGGKRGKTVAI